MNYNDAIVRLKDLNNMKHKLRKALGNIGIYLPEDVSMKEVLFCVYFYYTFNLFSDNNSKWKEKYFPLDGLTLYNFIENKMTSNPTNNKMYIDIANEIEAVTYPGRTGQSGNIILNRGLIEEFVEYSKNDDIKSKIGEISNNTVNTDNVLTNTKGLLNKLLSIWKWKKQVIDGTRRKRKEDKQTPVIEENSLLDDILKELQKESVYRLPRLKLNHVKLSNENLNTNSVSWFHQSLNYPFTVYTTPRNTYNRLDDIIKKMFSPSNWSYNHETIIDNIRPNTNLTLYYRLKQNPDNNPDSEFRNYETSGSFRNGSWNKVTKTKMNLYDVSLGQAINISYKDKYNGIYDKNNEVISAYSYLGWKPEIFLYSKSVKNNNSYAGYADELYFTNLTSKDSPMDHMNSLDENDFANLGLTILVPSLVEKYMLEKVPRLDSNLFKNNPSDQSYRYDLRDIEMIRGMETAFLVGIYPVDNDDNVIYKDPIVFQFFSGAQLNDDLGLSFADYRKIKSPTTKDNVLLRKYYNLKLGQVFYRNNYSRVSTEKRIKSVDITHLENGTDNLVINYENTKVGDVSKNLLYLYGRDAYMPYVGKTKLGLGQNHNITNPDDNTYIENIILPNNVEYTFKKNGNTKIAIQLYMATNNNSYMNGLEYFKKIKEANGGIINDNDTPSSEILENIPGSYMGLPYRIESTWNMGITTTKHKAFPYNESDIINNKITYPDYIYNNEYSMLLNNSRGLAYITEPVIIDCNKGNEYNAPWLDKKNAPYVSKVVTENFDYYSEDSRNWVDNKKCRTMKKGIYIKIPSDLDLYMLNDESVKKYVRRNKYSNNGTETLLEDKEFYGRISREKYIRAIKNALIGISINYNPEYTGRREGAKTLEWFKEKTGIRKLFRDTKYYEIIEDDGNLYIKLNGDSFVDLEYAGLGKYGTIKVQLVFKNEFFRSDDPDSPLNYKFVPVTGDVQLLREIAGQRIKLYRGGILAHPTDYNSKSERNTTYRVFNKYDASIDVSETKEITYKRMYTKGFPSIILEGGEMLFDSDSEYTSLDLIDDNSVYDIISIEMDYPHWQELQVNNIERSPISSMETDANKNSLPLPINILDLENFDFLEYGITENSYINNEGSNIKPKLILNQPNKDGESINTVNIDFYRMLNFWYFFRPKAKITSYTRDHTTTTKIDIEPYNEWRSRIINENKDFFNKKKTKIPSGINIINPYEFSQGENVIDLDDLFNIKCYRDYYQNSSEINTINKETNSENLYNVMKYIILDHIVYINNFNSQTVSSTPKSFNQENYKRAKFGGYLLDRLLYSDWVFTYRKGDSKKVDDIMRQAANDTALSLFNIWSSVTSNLRRVRDNSNTRMNNSPINITDYVRNTFEKLLSDYMLINTTNDSKDIYNIYYDRSNTDYYLNEIVLPGDKRLINLEDNIRCNIKTGYENGIQDNNMNKNLYNVFDNRAYKGDNRKIDVNNSKAKLRRGFRMGDKTPDNPFMGFSMPATTDTNLVPDYIHLVYCDIYWKDFDKSQNGLPLQVQPKTDFNVSPDKNILTDKSNFLTYDFTGFIEKYKLREWKDKGKHVIFRILIDEPTNEKHKDCPEYVTGEYYDNKYGKGFSPNFNAPGVEENYKCAIIALIKWMNNHANLFNGLIYTVELPLGIHGNGYMVSGGNIIPLMTKDIYNTVYNSLIESGSSSHAEDVPTVLYKLVFSSSVDMTIENSSKPYGWMFNDLGNREHFEEWTKYNLYGTDMTSYYIDGGAKHGGSNGHFYKSNYNKFKTYTQHRGYSGAIRNDMSMEELMKPDNFRELLYEMKTLTPMYVIGYVDKERYPEQYEALMNEMGYKYTITSAVIEVGYLNIHYSNEGKNGIKSVFDNSDNTLSIKLKYKNRLKDSQPFTSTYGIDRTLASQNLNRLMSISSDISNTKINMGDIKIYRTDYPTITTNSRPYADGVVFSVNNAVEKAYGKNMVDDVYLELVTRSGFTSYNNVAIKLANVNRTTEINLTDSGLLYMFVQNYTGSGELESWFNNMCMNHIKIDDNGWI